MKHKLKALKIVGILTITALVMMGCGAGGKKTENGALDSQTEQTETSETTEETVAETEVPEAAQGGTITVTDARGDVEIPANPEKIVDISGNSDILYLLGYSVIGTANSDAYDYTKFPAYLEDILKDASILGYSMQDTMDVEGMIALEPDLIIMSSVQEKMYDQLSEIAPTVMLSLAQTDWKEDVSSVASVMQKTKEAEDWLNSYKDKAAETGEAVKETYGEDTTYLSFLASGGQIYIFDKAGIGSILYEDMGLARPEGLPEQEDMSLPVVTYEGLASIDADYIFAIGTEEDLANLNESSIWNSMEAVKNGNIIELPSSPYFNQGYSSIGRLQFLDEITGLMENMNE